jgi:hypothetical protein
MGTGLLSKLPGSLEAVGEHIPDTGRAGGNLRYRLLDGIQCTFAAGLKSMCVYFRFNHEEISPRKARTTQTEEKRG